MKIKKELYLNIKTQLPNVNYEIGGIFFGKNGVIDDYILDWGDKGNNCKLSYTPNTIFLNKQIIEKEKEGKNFYGIFHTHFGMKTLSKCDKEYIEKIMWAAVEITDCLYFPIIVLPDKEMVVYKAICDRQEVKIYKESINLINMK